MSLGRPRGVVASAISTLVLTSCWFELPDVQTRVQTDSGAGGTEPGATGGGTAAGGTAGTGIGGGPATGGGGAGGIDGVGGDGQGGTGQGGTGQGGTGQGGTGQGGTGQGGTGQGGTGQGGTPCSEGHLDCNQEEGDGCEVYAAGDPENCGVCGRKCLASTCQWGRCEPQILAEESGILPVLAIDQDQVFWARHVSADSYEIKGAHKNGQNGAAIDTAANKPTSIAVSDASAYVYWSSHDGNGVYRVLKTGGISEAVMGVETAYAVESPSSVLVDGVEAYVVEEGGAQRLLHFSESGGSVTDLGTVGCIWVSGGMAADATRVYIACPTDHTVRWVARDGSGVGTIAADVPEPFSVAVDHAYVFFSGKSNDDAVWRAPIGGGPAEPIVKTRGAYHGAWALAIDEEWLYWAGDDGVHKAAKSGDPSTELGSASIRNGEQFVVDDEYLYWVDSYYSKVIRLVK